VRGLRWQLLHARHFGGLAQHLVDVDGDQTEAAALIIRGMEGAIAARTVTYDFARLMMQEADESSRGAGAAAFRQQDVRELKCSEFGEAIVRHFS